MQFLPQEIKLLIFEKLNYVEIHRCCIVCKDFKYVLYNNNTFWRKLHFTILQGTGKNKDFFKKSMIEYSESLKKHFLIETDEYILSKKTIEIFHKKIETVPPEIKFCFFLEKLAIISCFLKSISPQIGTLKNLKTLSLTNNGIKCIVPPMKNLNVLRISQNSPSLRLSSVAQLEELYMSSCYLERISPSISKLRNLKVLSLSKNKIIEIPSTIVCLENLQHINFSYNRIKIISSEIFSLKSLRYINLSNNEIEKIEGSKIESVVENIDLKNNKIASLPEYFIFFKKLKFLDISRNGLFDRQSYNVIWKLQSECEVTYY